MREKVQCAACDACDICDVCDEAENDAYVPKTGAIIFMAILSTVNSDHIDHIHQIGVIILQSVLESRNNSFPPPCSVNSYRINRLI
jgi:hypothetical protein